MEALPPEGLKDGNSTLSNKHGVVQAQAGHEGLECGSCQ